MLVKCLLTLFGSIALAAPLLPDAAGNPGCQLVVIKFFGNYFNECYKDGCPNECTEDTVLLDQSWDGSLAYYCPCGEMDAELASLTCLPKWVYPNWPELAGETWECESLCSVGCERLKESDVGQLSYTPVCTKCQ